MLAGSLVYGIARPYIHDDSIFMLFSDDISRGDNPYVYYDNKLPGTFVLTAAYLKVFGHGPYSGRVFAWLLMIATAGLTTLLAPAAFSRGERRWLGLLAFVLLWFCEGSLIYTEAGVALFGALCLLAIGRHFESPWSACLSGALVALACTFKQVAVGYSGALCLVWLLACLAGRISWRRCGTLVLCHVGCLAAATAAIWGVFSLQGIASTLWSRCFADMAGYARRMPFRGVLFLTVRTGWFVVPAFAVGAHRLWKRAFFRDDLLFQIACIVALIQMYPLTIRPYAHYLLACVPALVVMLSYGWLWYGRNLVREAHGAQRVVLAFGLVVLACCGTGAYLKRNSLRRIFLRDNAAETRNVADTIGRFIRSRDDRVLVVSGAVFNMASAATYYYAGVRPPWPFLFFKEVPLDVSRPHIETLPELMRRPDVKVVVFDPGASFSRRYYPVPPEIQAAVHSTLKQHFRPVLQASERTSLWARRDVTEGDVKIFRGPYANQ